MEEFPKFNTIEMGQGFPKIAGGGTVGPKLIGAEGGGGRIRITQGGYQKLYTFQK